MKTRMVRIGDICELKYGKNLPEGARMPGPFGVYGSNGRVGQHGAGITNGSTIIVGRKGSVGRIHYDEGPCWPIDTTYYVDAGHTQADLRWLFHQFRSLDLERLNRAAAIPGLNRSDVYELQVLLPPLPEQRRIAAILDQADALRTKRRQALARLDTLTQSIFLEMFGDPLTNPMTWPCSRMEEAISEGPKNGLYKPSSFYGSGTPIVRIDAFYDGTVSDPATLKRVRLSEVEAAEYALCENDIVINRVNSLEYLGKSALIPRLSERTVFESNMMRVRINSEQYHPRFVIELLQTSFTKRQILGRAKNAVNQSSINQKDVLALRLLSPPVEQQKGFALRALAAEGQKQAHRASLARLDSLFASLQYRAFRGEL